MSDPSDVSETPPSAAPPPPVARIACSDGQRAIDLSGYEQVHIALRVAYFGETHDGFARQDTTLNTIEAHLFAALCKLRLVPLGDYNPEHPGTTHAPTPPRYSRCGRTDKGVSAFGNAVSLVVRGRKLRSAAASDQPVPVPGPLPNFARMLNRVLPSTVRVVAWTPLKDAPMPTIGGPEFNDADDCDGDSTPAASGGGASRSERFRQFDARFSCRSRMYRYFFVSPMWSPSNNRYVTLDIAAMRDAAQRLVGVHDFRNFCKMDLVAVRHFVREIFSANIVSVGSAHAANNPTAGAPGTSGATATNEGGGCFYLEIKANAFLYNQIRCTMAILLLVGEGLEKSEIVDALLDVQRVPRKPCYEIADPSPLVLWDCDYDTRTFFDSPNSKWILADHEDGTSSAPSGGPTSWALSLLATMQRRVQQATVEQAIATSMLEWLQSANEGGGEEGAAKGQTSTIRTTHPSRRGYVPLLRRPTEASFDEKVGRLSENKKRRRDDNMSKGGGGGDCPSSDADAAEHRRSPRPGS